MWDWRQLEMKSIYFQNDIFENLSPKFSKLIGVWTGKLSLELPTLGLESKTWKLNKKWKLKQKWKRSGGQKQKEHKQNKRSHLLIYD